MRVNIEINEKYEDTLITIQAKEWTKELEELVKKLEQKSAKRLVGTEGDQSILLSPHEIDYVFAVNRKVYASIQNQALELSMKLYEAEDLLESHGFCRLSKSAIGNLNQIKCFELAFNGSLCVYFHSGSKEYVSRRYVQEVKQRIILGVDK
jgi:DNA-binding LytR/AlgR family response regulator